MTDRDPLVSSEWLAARIKEADVRVLDASFRMPGVLPSARDDYVAGHIPGAVFFDVDQVSDRSSPLPHMFPQAAQFGRDIAALGIRNSDTVVVSDQGGFLASARVWWMFLCFGHRDVRVLDGGVKKWRAEGRAIESGEVQVKPASFTATFNAGGVRTLAQLAADVESGAVQVVDARAVERFEGRVPEPRPGLRSGHIPRSRNLPYTALFDATTGVMKPSAALRQAFTTAGVRLDAPVVTCCGSGVSAAVLTLALVRLGITDSALYDGSWSEWGLVDGPAIAAGPA
ncbi:MAG: 3-mercaptopyruvate sulfurtransferase [Alphaproteobacteria bacterium]|nr:3-mercaptopyruvate sulfurtransferase [Alphaproteobacteria bacterium]